MTPEQIEELKTKSKEELIELIIDMDKKLFNLIKEMSLDKGIVTDKSLNDMFAQKIIDDEKEKTN